MAAKRVIHRQAPIKGGRVRSVAYVTPTLKTAIRYARVEREQSGSWIQSFATKFFSGHQRRRDP